MAIPRRLTLLLALTFSALFAGGMGYLYAPDPVNALPIQMIRTASLRFGVEADLIRAVILAESGGKANARSKRGAVGLMQLLPSTADELARALDEKTGLDLVDPELNIRLGTFYLARLLLRYHGELPLALAAYNAGPAALDRLQLAHPTGSSFDLVQQHAPHETRHYVRKVLRFREALRRRTP